MTDTRSSSETAYALAFGDICDELKCDHDLNAVLHAIRSRGAAQGAREAAEAWVWKDGQPIVPAQCSCHCGALVTAASGYLATFDRCAGSSSAVEAEEFANGRQAMRDALSAMTSTDRNTS